MREVTFGPDASADLKVTPIETFMGKSIDPISYSGSAKQYDTKEEAIAAGEWPDSADAFVLKGVNARLLASAKSAAYQAATKSLKDAYEKSPEKARKDFIESALKSPKFANIADVNARNQAVSDFADSMGF